MKIDKAKVELLLARKGLTHADVAKDYGANKNRIGRIINSEVIRPATAGKLAKALGVDVTEILA